MKTKVQAQRKFAQGAPVPPSTLTVVNPQADTKKDVSNGQHGRYLFRHKTSARKLLDMVSFEGVHKHNPVVLLERLQEPSQEQPQNEDEPIDEPPKLIDNNNISVSVLNAPIPRRIATLRNIAGLNSLCLRSRTIVDKKTRKTISKRRPFRKFPQKRHAERLNSKQVLKRKTTMKLRSTKRKSIDTDFSVDDEKPLMFFTKRVVRLKRKCKKPRLRKICVSKDTGEATKVQTNDLLYGTKGITNWISDNDMSVTLSNLSKDLENENLETPKVPVVNTETICVKHSNIVNTHKTDNEKLDTIQQKTESEKPLTKIIYAAKNCRQCKVVVENCKNYYKSNRNSAQVKVVEIPEPDTIQVSIQKKTSDGRKDLCSVVPSKIQIINEKNSSTNDKATAGPSSALDKIYEYQEETLNYTGKPQGFRRIHQTKIKKDQPSASKMLNGNTEKSDHKINKEKPDLRPNKDIVDNRGSKEKLDHKVNKEKHDHKVNKEKNDPKVIKEKLDQKVNKEKLDQKVNKEKHDHKANKEKLDHKVNKEKLDHKANKEKLDHKVNKEKLCHKVNKEKHDSKINKEKSDHKTSTDIYEIPSPPKSFDRAKVVEAKIFYPTEEEFKDPVAYFEKIMPIAAKYGICKVVAPKGFTPSCMMADTVRFKATNQYISRLCNRWGPVTRELCAMRAFLAAQNVPFSHAPILEGLEINLPKLLHFVKRQGGLKNTFQSRLYIDPARWSSLAAELNYTRLSNLEKKLDLIYVKYILPYDALTQSARQEHLETMDRKWLKRNERLMRRAQNPLHRQKKLLEESDSSDDDDIDETQFETAALDDAEDCIVPGRYMNIGNFKKIAETANTVFFSIRPSTADVEAKYWRIVLLGDEHVCVNAGAIDTGNEGYGFTIKKNDPYSRHPWNLKMFCENRGNVLRSLGRVLGVTIPTLHVGMVYTTSCWHRDPHGLPWIEYMHSGPEKIWYGIPDAESNRFRKAVESICPTACQNKSIWLPSDIAMIPPNLLLERGVSMSRVTQKPGEYIIVFPKAYSCSICTGFTVTESVYFATNSWVKTVNHVFQELRTSCEPTMFALEQLLIKVARDPNASLNMLQLVHGSFSTILSEELENRRQLELFGLKPCDPRQVERDNPSGRWNVIDDECEVCRSTLYLSRVKGVFDKHLSICLRHAIQVLEKKSDRNGKRDPSTYQLQYLFTNNELEEMMATVIERLTKATETK